MSSEYRKSALFEALLRDHGIRCIEKGGGGEEMTNS